jgi:serine/threonine-protein kinase HipA
MPDRLQVWLNGLRVAELERRRRSDTRIRIRHTDEALDRWPANTPLISCSLPSSGRFQNATPFLRGLLPEGGALAALAAHAGNLTVVDTFGLLARYGRDVAGALVIAEGEPDEALFALEPYDAESLADEVGELELNPLGIHDDSELSLAGLQNKLLLVKTEDGWARPRRGYPSTHILKAEDRRYPGMARAEADCLRLARTLGLTPVESAFAAFGEIPCLITERYDRVTGDGELPARVHQEDLCQAVGIDGAANRGRAKYQRRGGGGPGYRQAAELLERYAADPQAELTRLVSALAFTVAIGNADAHAKNLSFVHDTPETITLAPLYDTVPTMLWRNLTEESALAINGRFSLTRLTLDDIVAEAGTWTLDEGSARAAAVETLERLRAAAGELESTEPARLVAARCAAMLAGEAAGRPTA